MPRRLTRSLAACIVIAALTGCGERRPATSSAATALRPVTLPDLSRVSEPVRRQITEAHSTVVAKAKDPDTPAAELAATYGELGNLFLAAQYADAAVSCYVNAQALAREDPRWPYYLAHAYRIKSDSINAAAALERTIELRPTDLAALVYLGDEYLAQGKPEAAEPPLQKALSQDPGLAVALFGLGRAALAKKDYAGAVRHLEEALALDPQASTARYPLAMAYRELGQREKAEAHLSERGHVRFRYLPDPLILEVQQLLASAESYEFRGSAAFDQGEWIAAAWYFRKGVELEPNSVSVRLKLAEALRRGGAAQESLIHYEHAIKIASPAAAAPARFGYAMALVGLRRYGDARDRLTEAMTLHADRPAFGRALARLLAAAPDDRVRDGRRALSLARDLLEREATPDLYETLAMALAESGRFDEAANLQRDLISAARRAGHEDLARGMADNLRLYEARMPSRMPWRDADMP